MEPLEDFEHRHDLEGSPVPFFAFRQIIYEKSFIYYITTYNTIFDASIT